MSYPKIISFLFLSFIGLYIQKVSAQSLNINGDTIFVNMEAEVQIIFPTPPKSFNTTPENTEYRIWNVGTGINLIPGSADSIPVILSVSEADRNHKFILIYKKEISKKEAKLYYDYSTINKLAQHLKGKTFSKPNELKATTVNADRVKDDKKAITKIVAEQPVDSSLIYYALLAQGDKDLKAENYQNATLSFNKAHSLRPEDKIPIDRLAEIKAKLAEKENLATKKATEGKYPAIMEEAKIYLNQQKYKEAQDAYKRALEVKPGDEDATTLLKTLNNYFLKLSAQNEKLKNTGLQNNTVSQNEKTINKKQLTAENNYDSTVKSADNFFKNGDYGNAKKEYSKALSFSKKPYAQDQINKINKILNDELVRANAQKQKIAEQQLAEQQKIALALKTKNDSIATEAAAKKKYALTSELKAKNDSIATEAEIKKKYALALAQGKSSYTRNDFLNAKKFYEEAMNLFPLKEEPKNQLKIINNKLAEIEKVTEINNNYEQSIALADSQVIAKDYQSAIATYKQALIIKPLELYPTKQLKYLQSELVLVEKKKKEDKERRYTNALERADKAVTNKNYEEAKSAYSEALSVHPENEYAKRRLEIISYQLEIEKEKAKIVRDTVPVIPEKKSRRRSSKG